MNRRLLKTLSFSDALPPMLPKIHDVEVHQLRAHGRLLRLEHLLKEVLGRSFLPLATSLSLKCEAGLDSHHKPLLSAATWMAHKLRPDVTAPMEAMVPVAAALPRLPATAAWRWLAALILVVVSSRFYNLKTRRASHYLGTQVACSL